MNIMLIGAMKSSPIATSKWISKALKNLGHNVCEIDFRGGGQDPVPDKIDLLISWKASGVNVSDCKCKKVLWYPDDFDTMWGRQDLKSPLIKHYNKVYTPIKENITDIKSSLGLDISYLPCGVDTEIFKKEKVDKQIDVCFVGNTDENVYKERKRYLDKITEMFPNIKLWFGKAEIEPMVRVINCSKIVINVGLHLRGFQLRILEAMSCGTFLLTNDCESLSTVFPEKKNSSGEQVFDTYINEHQLIEKVEYWLVNNKEREKVAKAGFTEAVVKHTWENRVKQIIKDVM